MLSAQMLEDFENNLISFIYHQAWRQVWHGHGLPAHVYKSFLAHSRRLSDQFTAQRRQLDAHYMRLPATRSAYLIYFHLASVIRILAALEMMATDQLVEFRTPLRVLDLGCGSGAAAWAAYLFAQQHQGVIEKIYLTDKNKAILNDAKALLAWMAKCRDWRVLTETRLLDLEDQRTGKQLSRLGQFDLIIIANVVNELADSTRLVSVLNNLGENNLTSRGMILMVEPALQRTSRALTTLRDQIIQMGAWYTPSPCFHRQPCPLNQESRDWCHFEVAWQPPPVRYRLERALNHQSGCLKFSYLTLSRQAVKVPQQVRVISDILDTPQGYLALLCTAQGKMSYVLTKDKKNLGPWRSQIYRGATLSTKKKNSK